MRASVAVVLLSAVVASAQSAQNYSSELYMVIDPNKVKMELRANWCRAQTNTCGLLCGGNTYKNGCTQETLKYECTCASNKSMPGLQFYTQTVPTFICQELFRECNEANANKADEQKDCTDKIKNQCGTLDPPKAAVSSSDSGDSSDSPSSTVSSPTQRTNDAAASATSRGLAAPTMAPGDVGAVAAAAIGVFAYL